MQDQINWHFHVFFMLFFFAFGGVLLWRAKREVRGWRRISALTNLYFMDKGGKRHDEFLNHFCLMGASVVNDPTQMLSGTLKGRELISMNWFFQSETSLNAIRGGFAYTVVELEKPRPRLHVFHNNLKNFAAVSGETIMVLDDDEFASQYHLLCKDRKGADAFFTDEVKHFLGSEGVFWLEVSDKWLLLAHQGIWEPENFQAGVERLSHFLTLIGERPIT